VPVDHEAFCRILGAFPTGVAIVTACAEDGTPKGLTSSAVCSVSASPPLLLVCVDKKSRTLEAIQSSGAFVANILAAGAEELSRKFASKAHDKFAGVVWEPAESAGGAPILVDDVEAYAECLVAQVVDAGDHYVIIGSVEGGGVKARAPLLYFQGRYKTFGEFSHREAS
jgi:flavin reductase (DIM6/NTAB) family NADH-FMN oxidoreductase RutF